nr:hypothetical protein CFP56_09348 [Quercus suber]
MVLRRNLSDRGGLVGPVANEPRIPTEYRAPGGQQNLSLGAAQPSNRDGAAGSSYVERSSLTVPGPSGLPPSYEDSVGAAPSIASDRPASDDKSSTGSLLNSDSDAESEGFDVESLQGDEEDWALDEAVPDPPSYEEIEGPRRTSDELVEDVLTTSHQPVQVPQTFQPLPCPVIIPQRRPGDKGRGFVRAYAPVLANNGIEQEQFLAFLKSFHKASQASPLFTAIQVSASIASFAPSVIAMAVVTALEVAAQAGREVQYRQRANHFLDRMNEEVFKPAGLYAMVIKYKQNLDVTRHGHYTQTGAHIGIGTERINLTASHAIAKYSNEGSDVINSRMQDLQLVSNTTKGTIELPEAAPLIFPYLDRAIDLEAGSGSTQNRVKDHGAFLQDYRDRRAQATYTTSDPDKVFAPSEDQRGFKSTLSDPTHATYHDAHPGFTPGGFLASKRQRRLDKYAYKLEKRIDKHMEKSQEKVLKYEQKLSEGRSLSRHKQMKLERHSHALDALTSQRNSLCGRGRNGLVSTLLATAIDASSKYHEKQPARELHQHSHGTGAQYNGSSLSTPSLARSGSSLTSQNSIASRHQARRDAHMAARPGGPVRRRMKEDVLYLMIVNMPTPAELAEARDLLGIRQR